MSQTTPSKSTATAALSNLAGRVAAYEQARRSGTLSGVEGVRADLPRNLPENDENALMAAAVTALELPITPRIVAHDTSKAWMLVVLECGLFGVIAKRETSGRAYCWAVPSATEFVAANKLRATYSIQAD